MRLVTVIDRKEPRIIRGLTKMDSERYDCKDFLYKLYHIDNFITKDDYVLLAIREKRMIDNVQRHILKAGIRMEQIILISEWDSIITDEMKIVEKYLFDRHCYDGIMIGMSHLENGIMLDQMKGSFVKIGIPSIDIFYICRIIQLLINANKLSGLRQIIFELPYYMFNWDISRSTKMIERFQIAYYFGDYHHFGENDDEKIQLEHMLILNDAMKEKMIREKDYVAKCFVNTSDKHNELSLFNIICRSVRTGILELEDQRKLCEKEYHIWSKMHWDTVEENRIKWRKMIMLLTKVYPDIKIYVAVFPHNPYFIKCHKNDIKRMRAMFYKSVQCGGKVTIIDHFNYYLPFWCFRDECHLNELGSHIYSRALNRNLLQT